MWGRRLVRGGVPCACGASTGGDQPQSGPSGSCGAMLPCSLESGLSCRSEEALGLGNTGHVATYTFLPVKMLRFPTWRGCAGDPGGCLTQDLLPSHPYLGRPTC